MVASVAYNHMVKCDHIFKGRPLTAKLRRQINQWAYVTPSAPGGNDISRTINEILWFVDIELAHARAQGGPVETENSGRAAVAAHFPFYLIQHLDNVFTLDISQGSVWSG